MTFLVETERRARIERSSLHLAFLTAASETSSRLTRLYSYCGTGVWISFKDLALPTKQLVQCWSKHQTLLASLLTQTDGICPEFRIQQAWRGAQGLAHLTNSQIHADCPAGPGATLWELRGNYSLQGGIKNCSQMFFSWKGFNTP